VSDGTILNYVNLLHGVFKTARIKEWVAENVVEYIDNRPESRNQDEPTRCPRMSSRRFSTCALTVTSAGSRQSSTGSLRPPG
jgi:hypothetical protein